MSLGQIRMKYEISAPDHLHNPRNLVVLTCSREQWQTQEQLHGNTAQ